MTLLYLRNGNSKKDRKFVMDSLSGKNGTFPYLPVGENEDKEQNLKEDNTIFLFLHDLSIEMEDYFVNNMHSVETALN